MGYRLPNEAQCGTTANNNGWHTKWHASRDHLPIYSSKSVTYIKSMVQRVGFEPRTRLHVGLISMLPLPYRRRLQRFEPETDNRANRC
jgi:hypothetical protein